MKAASHTTFSAFKRYANLKEGDIQILVGRKTEPLPYVTYEEYQEIDLENTKNVEKYCRLLQRFARFCKKTWKKRGKKKNNI